VGAPRKMPKDELLSKLATLRNEGKTCKQIARELGGIYSANYISILCGEWGFRINRNVLR
jgi:hypothetical protein